MSEVMALIDADAIVWIASWGLTTPDELKKGITKIDDIIKDIVTQAYADDFMVYLKGESNFRNRIIDDYKGHRSNEKPPLFERLFSYLVREYNALESVDQEADDAIGIEAFRRMSMESKYIICTTDKDMKQIPGPHYNYHAKSRVGFNTTTDEADHFLYSQIISGDPTDNIKGLFRVGEKTAMKWLSSCTNNIESYEIVAQAWQNAHPEDWEQRMTECAQLVYIRRKPREMWQIESHSIIDNIWSD